MTNKTPGQIACEAWTAHHLAHHKCNMTGWDELKDADKNDWEYAGEMILQTFKSDD
jgi:hypothetical protein